MLKFVQGPNLAPPLAPPPPPKKKKSQCGKGKVGTKYKIPPQTKKLFAFDTCWEKENR